MAAERKPLTLEGREDVSRGLAQGLTNKEIAQAMNRNESVVCREIKRHGGRRAYRAHKAHAAARKSRKRPNERKMDGDPELRERVMGSLRIGWSPEQIAGRPAFQRNRGETGMAVSPEGICTWIYAQPKDALKCAGR